jgi:hypothetical protein
MIKLINQQLNLSDKEEELALRRRGQHQFIDGLHELTVDNDEWIAATGDKGREWRNSVLQKYSKRRLKLRPRPEASPVEEQSGEEEREITPPYSFDETKKRTAGKPGAKVRPSVVRSRSLPRPGKGKGKGKGQSKSSKEIAVSEGDRTSGNESEFEVIQRTASKLSLGKRKTGVARSKNADEDARKSK